MRYNSVICHYRISRLGAWKVGFNQSIFIQFGDICVREGKLVWTVISVSFTPERISRFLSLFTYCVDFQWNSYIAYIHVSWTERICIFLWPCNCLIILRSLRCGTDSFNSVWRILRSGSSVPNSNTMADGGVCDKDETTVVIFFKQKQKFSLLYQCCLFICFPFFSCSLATIKMPIFEQGSPSGGLSCVR